MKLIRSAKGKIHVVDNWGEESRFYKRTLCNKYIDKENIIVNGEPNLDKPTCKTCLQILKANELEQE